MFMAGSPSRRIGSLSRKIDYGLEQTGEVSKTRRTAQDAEEVEHVVRQNSLSNNSFEPSLARIRSPRPVTAGVGR